MEDGEEKNRQIIFWKRNELGNKYIHQYCLEEVWAPGDTEPRQVLRRLEAKKGSPNKTEVGRIVVSREELFDAINEWHQHSGHLGQERTWEYCRTTKNWNVTQDHSPASWPLACLYL